MMLDSLDAAFVDRWRTTWAPVVTGVAIAEPDVVTAAEGGPAAVAAPPDRPLPTHEGDFIDRLLAAAPDAWAALADEVVEARGRGHRAIAIAACESGAGCSTLVDGLVRVLRGRGRDVVGCRPTDLPDEGPTHDRRILLVDGGVWFPPGRIHRARLIVASSGCDAVILVVRSGSHPPAAWSSALEAIGVVPLGEVLSFVPPSSRS